MMTKCGNDGKTVEKGNRCTRTHKIIISLEKLCFGYENNFLVLILKIKGVGMYLYSKKK